MKCRSPYPWKPAAAFSLPSKTSAGMALFRDDALRLLYHEFRYCSSMQKHVIPLLIHSKRIDFAMVNLLFTIAKSIILSSLRDLGVPCFAVIVDVEDHGKLKR